MKKILLLLRQSRWMKKLKWIKALQPPQFPRLCLSLLLKRLALKKWKMMMWTLAAPHP